MKRLTLLLLPLMLLMVSCGSKSKPSLLNQTNLKSSFIVLAGDSAYSLRTPGGAVLKIAKNSFSVEANEKVQIEIKEAYTAGEMLLAGLTTKSNGKLLRSGGMIYLDATANGKEVKIVKPIQISIPTNGYDSEMQLFKGEIKNDSSINWVDPQPLDTSITAKALLGGKALFKANCASCHKPGVDFTGPGLAGCREREPNPEWAFQFTDNANAMIGTDPYAKALKRKFGSVMTQFNLKKEEIKTILDYCDSEMPEQAPKVPGTTAQQNNAPPCIDTFYRPMPDTSIAVMPADTTLQDSVSQAHAPNATDQMMYQFKVFESGWYNIDCFIDANQGALTNVILYSSIKIPRDQDAVVYLCIPKRRLLTSGYEASDDSYSFRDADGTIPLILNDEAFIFVMSTNKAKEMFYGITKFTVQMKQNIAVSLKEGSKESILRSIKNNKLDDVKIDVNKPETVVVKIPTEDYKKEDSLKRTEMQMQIMERPCGVSDSGRSEPNQYQNLK